MFLRIKESNIILSLNRSSFILLLITLLSLTLFNITLFSQTDISGIVNTDSDWTLQGSPYIVVDDLTIPSGVSLTIEPGVKILFNKNVSLIVKGDLFAAGEDDSRIVFESAIENERWGGIRIIDFGSSYGSFIDSESDIEIKDKTNIEFTGKPKSYDETYDYKQGTILQNCIIRDVGEHKLSREKRGNKVSGAIYCYNSSPFIENCIIEENEIGKGGAITCNYYSSPLIKDCLIQNNSSQSGGGGLYCFFFSTPIIIDNIFNNNLSPDYGGALLSNASSPVIMSNVFYKNQSELRGGALALLASEPTVKNNLFRENKAKKDGGAMVIEKSIMQLNQCAFLDNGDIEVIVGEGDKNIKATNNYWGTTNLSSISDMIYDSEENPKNVSMEILDIRKFLHADLPYSPYNTRNLSLKYDKKFETDLTVDLSQDFPIYIQVEADGGSEIYKDIVSVWIRSSSSDRRGMHLKLYETELESGLYRGSAMVKKRSKHEKNIIAGKVGEIISISIDLNPEEIYTFTLQDKIPYVVSTELENEKNRERVIGHTPTFNWEYLDIRSKPQLAYQLQVGKDLSWKKAPLFDTKKVSSKDKKYTLTKLTLEDGQKYFYRVRVFNGDKWSGYLGGLFRMNQIALKPTIVSPRLDIIHNGKTVEFVTNEVSEPDGDSLLYTFEFSLDKNFNTLVEKSELLKTNKITNKIEFIDNEKYYWRVKVFDGYEDSKYMDKSFFYVNYKEENPEPTVLTYPADNSTINTTKPIFLWEEALDPDPKSELTYKLQYSTDKSFSKNVISRTKLSDTTANIKGNELKHNTNYFYRVIATDLTDKMSTSKVFTFKIDTKPSKPVLITGLEELKAHHEISWNASSDPQDGDVLTYTLQISKTEDFKTVIMTHTNIKDTKLALPNLNGNKFLSDDKRYYYRVKAIDNHKVSSSYSKPGTYIFNRVNDTPETVVAGFNIKDNVIVKTTSPKLSFTSAKDQDFSDNSTNLKYEAMLATDKNFKSNKVTFVGFKGEASITAKNLIDDKKYYYKLRTIDDDNAKSKWSKIHSFIINVFEDSPKEFELASMKNDFITYKMKNLQFKWNKTTDNDFGSSVKYSFAYSKNSNFTDKKVYNNLKSVDFVLYDKLENETTYYWKVTAKDNHGNTTECSTPFRFTVNSTPSVPKLYNTANGKERTVMDQLAWIKSKDPDPSDKLTYIVQVSKDNLFEKPIITSGRISKNQNIIGELLKRIDTDKKLVDNETYFWRVKARDNNANYSEYSEIDNFFFNRINNAPMVIEDNVSPSNSITLNDSRNITFKWGAEDPDKSDDSKNISSILQIDKNNFKSKAITHDLAINKGQFSFTRKLEDNTVWYWRVKVIDNDKKSSKWSKVNEFILNLKEEGPISFNLLKPSNNYETYETKPKFNWGISKDKDPRSTVFYNFLLSKDKDFSSNIISEKMDPTSFTSNIELENGTEYYWKVISEDNTARTRNSKQVFKFKINSTPTVPEFENKNDEEITLDKGDITWSKSKDPNPKDRVFYSFEISETKIFSNILSVTGTISSNKFNLNKISKSDLSSLVDNNSYYMRVKAIDNNGYESEYSKVLKFYFNRSNDAPLATSVITPADMDVLRTQKPMIKWEPLEDPDFSDNNKNIRSIIQFYPEKVFDDTKIRYQYKVAKGQNYYKVTDKLKDNKKWFFRMRSIDKHGKSNRWTEVREILVNKQEDSPTKFKLSEPRGMLVKPKELIFKWKKSSDPDLDSSIKYEIIISESIKFDKNSSSTVVIENLVNTTYKLESLLNPGTYFWKVIAIDNTDRKTDCEGYYKFSINSDPSVPKIYQPAKGKEKTVMSQLAFIKSTDPDKDDKLSYTIQISPDENFSDISLTRKGISKTDNIVGILLKKIDTKKVLKDNTVYYWRVKAVDNYKNESSYSDSDYFFFNRVNNAPIINEDKCMPLDEKRFTSSTKVKFSWDATDPDKSDTYKNIKYILMIDDKDFKNPKYNLAINKGQLSFSKNLADNTKWYWKVKAIDNDKKSSNFSTIRSFIIDTKEEAPKTFKLIKPRGKTKGINVKFDWTESIDNDVDSKITYSLHFSNDKKFSKIETTIINDITDTSYELKNVFTVGYSYYWKVQAKDETGKTVWSKSYEKFDMIK